MIEKVYVDFEARKLSDARAIVMNSSFALSPEALSERFGYVISSRHKKGLQEGSFRTFQAERYGGGGLLSNGGGVRCGNYAGLQVKGIGRNQLVGEGVDFWYSHGGVTVAEALKEYIWGEVLHSALPWGANRVMGVLDTGLTSWKRGPAGRERARRALIVREQSVRPGHFERAIYFRPTKRAATLPSDTERVASAIAVIQHHLPKPRSSRQALSVMDEINQGLGEFSSRMAQQLAAARARRLMHGGLSSSNTCLDGRWIDYGSVSFLPTFANTRNITPGFWMDHTSLGAILDNLIFYISKYSPAARTGGLIKPHDLRAHFQQQLSMAMSREFVLLTGIPSDVLDQCWKSCAADISQLAAAMIGMCSSGCTQSHWGVPQSLGQHGSFKAREIPASLALGVGTPYFEEAITALVPDTNLRSALCQSYAHVYKACEKTAAEQGIGEDAFRRLVWLSATLRGGHVEALFEPSLGPYLNRELDAEEQQGASAWAACEDLIDEARPLFDHPKDMKRRLRASGRTGVYYCARSNALLSDEQSWPWTTQNIAEISRGHVVIDGEERI